MAEMIISADGKQAFTMMDMIESHIEMGYGDTWVDINKREWATPKDIGAEVILIKGTFGNPDEQKAIIVKAPPKYHDKGGRLIAIQLGGATGYQYVNPQYVRLVKIEGKVA